MAKTRRTGWPPGLQLLIQLWGQAKGTAIVSPIYLPGSDGETMETVADLIFLGSKISVDGDHSHETTRCLLLGRKAMTNLDSILRSRDITLPTKVYIVKSLIFPESYMDVRVGP